MTTPSSHSGYREIARKALHPKTGIPSLSDWEVFLHGFTDTNMRGDSRRIYDCIIDLFPTPESVLDWPIGLDLPNTGGCENLQSRVSAGKWLRHNAANWETIAPLLRCRTPASQESVRDFVKPSKNQNKLLKKAMKGAKYKGADMHMLWGGCNVPVIDIQLMRYMAPEVLGMPWRPWVIEQLEAHKESGEPLLLNPGAPAKLQKWISAAEIDITEKTHISGEEKKQQAAIQGSVGRYGVWRDAAYRMADAEGLPANRWHVANWLEARAQGDPDKPETATRNQADTLRLAAVQQFSEYTFGPTKFPDAPATWPLPPERYEEKNPGSHLDTSDVTYNIPDQWHDAIKLDRFRRQPSDMNVLFQVDGIMVNFKYYEQWNEFSLDIVREDFQEPSLANLIALKQFVYDMRDANPGVPFLIEATDAKRARVYQRAGFIPEIPIEDVEEEMDFHQMSLPGVPASHRRPASHVDTSKISYNVPDQWHHRLLLTKPGWQHSDKFSLYQVDSVLVYLWYDKDEDEDSMFFTVDIERIEAGTGAEAPSIGNLQQLKRFVYDVRNANPGVPFVITATDAKRARVYQRAGFIPERPIEEVEAEGVMHEMTLPGVPAAHRGPAVYDKDYKGTPTWHREQISLIMRGQTGQTLRTSTAIAWLKRLREQALPKVGKYGVGKEWEHIVDILDMHLESFEGFGPNKVRVTPELRAKAVQEYEDGVPSPFIAEQYGVAHTTVLSWVREAGTEVRSGYEERGVKAKAVQEYEDGGSSRDIAERYGISHQAVINWVREAGTEVQVRPSGQPRYAPEFKAEVVETYKDRPDLTLQNISEMYRVTHATIMDWVKAAGVPLRGRGSHGRGANPEKRWGNPSEYTPFIDISGLSEYASEIEALVG